MPGGAGETISTARIILFYATSGSTLMLQKSEGFRAKATKGEAVYVCGPLTLAAYFYLDLAMALQKDAS